MYKFGDKLMGSMVGVGAVRRWSCGFGVFILQSVSKKTTLPDIVKNRLFNRFFLPHKNQKICIFWCFDIIAP